MRFLIVLVVLQIAVASLLHGQQLLPTDQQKSDIKLLIDQYSEAREKRDTVLLKRILTSEIDQLVSTGEWRNGMDAAVKGMLTSSTNSPGKRTLVIEKIRLLNLLVAVVDCRYEIENADNNARKMWSTFVVVSNKGTWKISAIRNMLPSSQ